MTDAPPSSLTLRFDDEADQVVEIALTRDEAQALADGSKRYVHIATDRGPLITPDGDLGTTHDSFDAAAERNIQQRGSQ